MYTGTPMSNLHVDSVIKSFGTKQVLTDVYLSCKRGEIIGLLGRNGSGKSTLLKIIFGSLQAERKFIKVGDKIINGLFDNRNLVSYLPQDHFLPNHIRVSTLISLLCDRENALLIKDNELISGMLDKKCKQLSGGENRLLEIMLIIHSNARYILIDEPFNGVAPIYKDIIKHMIREQSKSKGFIITDHDYRNILDISTRIILMDDGATKAIAKTDDLIRWGYIPE
jgi:ABC-type multidrug transport system ATPase subunit